MKNWSTKNCRILQLLDKRSNAYLIDTGNLRILVDTGIERKYPSLRHRIESIYGDATKIDYLVLTHTHYDHCQSAARIKADTGAKLMVHRSEAENLKNGFTSLPAGTLLPTKIISGLGNKYFSGIGEYAAVIPDISVDEEYIIEHEPFLKVMHTPGHSEGSVSVIVEDEIALSGDTVFNIWKGRVFPPFANDTSKLLKSWEKLMDSGCHLFLPGHGKPVSIEMLVKEYGKRS